ncbi:MAG: penicillin-binding transpeptidase domain-containing protein [Planctomycetota bacterium]
MRSLIPSMFHRRLLLLAGLMAIPLVAMLVQLGRLTIAQGGELREEAERRLVVRTWSPTVRGAVLDRAGRILAADRPSYDLAIDYRVLSGSWAESKAGRYARRRHAELWPELGPEQRSDLVDRYASVFSEHINRSYRELAEAAGVPETELSETREQIVAGVDRMFGSIVRSRRASLERELTRGQELTTEIEAEIDRRANRPIAEMTRPHTLIAGLDDPVAFELIRRAADTVPLARLQAPGLEPEDWTVPRHPGMTVEDAGRRVYPFETVVVDVDRSTLPGPLRSEGTESITVEGVATQLLGWMRSRPFAEDAAHRKERVEDDSRFAERVLTEDGVDRGRYRPGDRVGSSGMESSLEDDLRGLRGLTTVQLDTGRSTTIDPAPGGDVELALDVRLQARVQGIMAPSSEGGPGLAEVQPWHDASGEPALPLGTPLYGGAVVLEVDTGEILAMVSTPSFTREQLASDPSSVFEDPVRQPHLNRAIAVPYQPGSIVKPLIICGAAKRGNHLPGERIACTGHFLPNSRGIMRCWIYRDRFGLTTHSAQLGHDPTGAEAVQVSCNIYFYTLGQRLGRNGVTEVMRWFGVGRRFDLGVGMEYPGQIGPGGDPDALEPSDPIFIGIGQGPVDWTPLHAAESYATLARGGVTLRPRLVRDGSPPEVIDLELPPDAIDEALKGLELSVNDALGTGHHVTIDGRRENLWDIPGVRVAGKTGTAQASPRVVDPDGDGPEPAEVVREGDHSWFVVLVGPEGGRYEYSIAVVMEYAGSGGRVSGPIIAQIVRALTAEGYLRNVG